MAAATAGAYQWPHSSPSPRHSPLSITNASTVSPIYPDRPIKPLPKRRLRDRLSSEQGDAMPLPPQAPNTSPIFVYPYAHVEQERPECRPLRAGSGSHHGCVDCGYDQSGHGSEEDEEDERQRSMQFAPESLQMTRRNGDYYGNGKAAMRTDWDSKPGPSRSTASSADGYESFENTNNKKKRKIPQSNMGGMGHQSTMSADMANIGLSRRDGETEELYEGSSSHTTYTYGHQTVTSPAGPFNAASGKGRGNRSGRGSLDRRPLAVIKNGMNAPRPDPSRPVTSSMTGPPQSGEPGIISAAIANAAQQRSTTPTNSNESLLLQATKSPPQKTDFTFTPEGGEHRPVWPGQQSGMPSGYRQAPPSGRHPDTRRGVQYGTQTSPNMNGPQMPSNQPQHGQPSTAGPPPPKQKKPRRPGRAYAAAARQRRLQQQYQNFHHPPRKEDIWICEFCEYESIFGTPPTALIRQYEIKDRKVRREVAERRRLLEKAKMKGRKGKKGNKGKNSASQNQQHAAPANQQRYDPPMDEPLGEGEEEYYEDDESYEYDDGDPALNALPPPPHLHPHSHPHTHSHPHAHAHAHNHTHTHDHSHSHSHSHHPHDHDHSHDHSHPHTSAGATNGAYPSSSKTVH